MSEREEEDELWAATERGVVEPLLELAPDWSREQIQHALGLFRTNAGRAAGCGAGLQDGQTAPARALYPALSLLSHSCRPNCAVLPRPGYRLAVTTTRAVLAGEELTISYNSVLAGRIHRMTDLQVAKQNSPC